MQNTSLPNSSFILSKPYLPHFIYSTSVIPVFILYNSYSHSSNIPINSLWSEKKNLYLAGIHSIDKKITVNTLPFFFFIKAVPEKNMYQSSTQILSSTSVFIFDNCQKCFLSSKSTLEWVLKDHVTLKWQKLKIQLAHHMNALHYKMYFKVKEASFKNI